MLQTMETQREAIDSEGYVNVNPRGRVSQGHVGTNRVQGENTNVASTEAPPAQSRQQPVNAIVEGTINMDS